MADSKAGEAGKILGFNGLRGLSIVFVYLSHKCGLEFYAGAIGVWTFFVLSGYLIIGELHRQRIEIERGSYGLATGLKIFYLKRFIRILPAYYAVVTLLFLLRHFYEWVGPDLGFRYHLIYLSNFWIAFSQSACGPFGVLWSLAVEQQFYAIAPLFLLMVPSRWHLQLCVAVAGALALTYLVMTLDGLQPGTIYLVSPWNYATIVLGGMGYLLLETYDCRSLFHSPWALALSSMALLSFPASWLLFREHDPQRMSQVFLATFSIAYLVCWIRVRQDCLVVRALEWRPVEYIGVISYGFYLIHNFIPNPLGRALSIYAGVTLSDDVKYTIGAAFGFVVSLSLAHLSWVYFERPLLRQKTRLTRLALGRATPHGHAIVLP